MLHSSSNLEVVNFRNDVKMNFEPRMLKWIRLEAVQWAEERKSAAVLQLVTENEVIQERLLAQEAANEARIAAGQEPRSINARELFQGVQVPQVRFSTLPVHALEMRTF